jgi:hypothetical protein
MGWISIFLRPIVRLFERGEEVWMGCVDGGGGGGGERDLEVERKVVEAAEGLGFLEHSAESPAS